MTDITARTPVAITVSVWKALVLREALSRLFGRRAAWLWLFVEPLFHVAYLMVLFSTVRVRHVGGFETPMWILVGLLGYFMFQRTGRQGAGAIGANRQLFVYRQVLPVDTVLARSLLEGMLMIAVVALLLAAAGLLGLQAWPDDLLSVLAAFAGLWMCGLGFGLISAVAIELTPEIGRVIAMLTRPLYLLSGVIFPLNAAPPVFREWLMLNPLAHGLELARSGFAPYYHAVPGADFGYLHLWGLGLVMVGLLLQVGFARRVVAQ